MNKSILLSAILLFANITAASAEGADPVLGQYFMTAALLGLRDGTMSSSEAADLFRSAADNLNGVNGVLAGELRQAADALDGPGIAGEDLQNTIADAAGLGNGNESADGAEAGLGSGGSGAGPTGKHNLEKEDESSESYEN
ncbi:hypothetical protein ACH518_06790 [Methylomonas sp. HW2-6]|uniref:hypothetical protein n=1 Tax=Methylomonas sp. HW2-6 TaxID=3376687 RepID=UPI0040412B9E